MRSRYWALAAALPALAAGCDAGRPPVAYGEPTSIIAAAADSLWAVVGDSVHSALEPIVFTVREERTFDLTHAAPRASEWKRLREFKRLLVIGTRDDAWVAPVLGAAVGGAPRSLPALVEAADVWANRQEAVAIVLSRPGAEEEVYALLPELRRRLDADYRQYVLERMYTSGRDEALADSLTRLAGFSLLLPNVYAWSRRDSIFLFTNTYREGQLLRAIIVTWRPSAAAPLSAESALAWRDEVSARHYELRQTTQREPLHIQAVAVGGGQGIEVRGIWSSSGSFPAAGPFLDRLLVCPAQGRMYFLDAWLYAPGKKKYEYLIQLETLLDTFRCGGT
ncbi:MAG: DUF4837 family protein [Gemmatimonadetes bacterium]|nr:DUF4837 family protein [Gemmatimonadota bacterium]